MASARADRVGFDSLRAAPRVLLESSLGWLHGLAVCLLVVTCLGCGKPQSQPMEVRSTAAPTAPAATPTLPPTVSASSVAPSLTATATATASAVPAREQVVVRLTRNELLLDGQRVAATSHPGFAKSVRGGHHQAGLPSLPDVLRAARPRRVKVVADGDVSYLILVEVVRDIRRTGVQHWELRADGTERGKFTFAEGEPELTVNDLYFGKSTALRKSTSQLQREGPGKARRVQLVLDFGSSVADVAPVLQAVAGLEVELGFHTGPY